MSPASSSTAPGEALAELSHERPRLLVPVLLVVFLAALDLTVVAPILPSVIIDLKISAADADRYSWIVLAYLVAYTVTVPLTGRISDFAGRIPVFVSAMLLFLAGSLVVATSHALGPMIAGRTLQGLGGGAMLPVSMALVADIVPVRRRAATLGLVAAVDTFGWVLGPVWGALVNGLFGSWRAIFWLNLPLGLGAAAILLGSRIKLPRRENRALPNLLSALCGTIGLVLFCLALSTGGEGGLSANQGTGILGGETNPLANYRWYLLAVSIIAFVVFAFLERRAANPILPPSLIRQRIFQVAGAANVLVGAALIIAMVNAPLVVALLANENSVSRDTALLLGSFTLAMTVGAFLGGRLVERAGPRLIAATGLLIAFAGFVVMHWWPDTLQLPLMAATIAIAGFGLGTVIAPIGEVAIRAARAVDYGAASGLVLLARLLGMTVGLAAITAFGLQRLETAVNKLPPLAPLPGETAAAYFQREQDFVNAQVVPLTLDVIRETFLIAAAICLLAAGIVTLLRLGRTEAASAGSGDGA